MHNCPHFNEISKKHLIAIDYGKKFTGISLYKVDIDPFPLAHGRIEFLNNEKLIQDINDIIEEEFVDILVMGIPYFTDGTESTLTKELKLFFKTLESKVDIPCYSIDETLTSFEAEQRMLQDPKYNFKIDPTKIDAVSATIIMEEFVKNSKEKI